ncbi:MAG: hypothetical protein NTY37_13435 [Methanothrix sp.]|nr:hypothetical protein [Methanothrix sp.]
MNKKDGLVLILISLLTLFAFSATTALGGLGVTGAIIEMEVNSGEHISQNIMVHSGPDDAPMEILATVMGYGQSPSGGSTEILPENDLSPYTARPFLKVTPATLQLDPGQEKTVTLDGDIPQDVGAGGRYAIVNIHTKPTGNGTVGISLAINVPVRLTIANTEQIKTGTVKSIKLGDPVSGVQQNVTLEFENTGNHHYLTQVDASLKDRNGSVIAKASPLISYSPVLPASARTFEISIRPDKTPPAGDYEINTTVSTDDGIVLAEKSLNFKI